LTRSNASLSNEVCMRNGCNIHAMSDPTNLRRSDRFRADRDADGGLARVAAAIGEPARARMLCCLLDGHTRTGTELAVVAEVGASTASVHLEKLVGAQLVKVVAQGKHRYYSLAGPNVARALEGLSVVAGVWSSCGKFEPSTPSRLHAARTCYDHIAGTLGVGLHDRMRAMDWLTARRNGFRGGYDLTRKGEAALAAMGIDVTAMRATRRRFAFACLDWSERRPHVGGALGAALLAIALRREWVVQDLDSRALEITARGRREMMSRFGVRV
jgi:DNA-binding transcriptional ArsR family regulator